MPDRTGRTGPGRWTNVRTPAAGVLWTNDTTTVGFEPVPIPDNDPQLVLDAIAAATGTPSELFDALAEDIGMRVIVGELDRWTARPGRRG